MRKIILLALTALNWKSGKYGEIELQKALKDNFKF